MGYKKVAIMESGYRWSSVASSQGLREMPGACGAKRLKV